jgi:type III pantothenate kinase
MELVIDAGNSNIVFALYKEGEWIWVDRLDTRSDLSRIILQAYYTDFLLEHDILAEDINYISISSVVTEINDVLRESIVFYFGKEPTFLSPEIFTKLPLHIPKPYEIGSDLVANAYSIFKGEWGNTIIVDFGTALTFTVFTENQGIEGVTIAPGLQTAINALSMQTSKLPEVPLEFPSSVIGKNTSHAIQAGVMYGYIGLVKELIEKIRSEKEGSYRCIATGGMSGIMDPIKPYFDKIDPYLTLDGIRLIGAFNRSRISK